MLQRQRLDDARMMRGQIGGRQGTARRLEVRRDARGELTPIEVVESRLREMLERRGEARLAEQGADLRHRAVDEVRLGETRHLAQLVELGRRRRRLALRHGHAAARVVDRVLEQARERQLPAETLLRGAVGRIPARHCSRDGDRRERSAKRNRAITRIAVGGRRDSACRRTARIDSERRAVGRRDQPEAVAAEAIHMRIHRCDRRSRGDHGFDRVGAVAQRGNGTLCGQRMRCDGHAAPAADRVQETMQTSGHSKSLFGTKSGY